MLRTKRCGSVLLEPITRVARRGGLTCATSGLTPVATRALATIVEGVGWLPVSRTIFVEMRRTVTEASFAGDAALVVPPTCRHTGVTCDSAAPFQCLTITRPWEREVATAREDGDYEHDGPYDVHVGHRRFCRLTDAVSGARSASARAPDSLVTFYQRSSDCKPVRFAIRANMLGPISSSS